jgi:hypothetical protein
VVWARGGISTTICPKSVITAQSWAWLEEYFVWRKLGRADPDQMDTRKVEAFLILEEEVNHARED